MLRLLAVLGEGIALLPEFLARGNSEDKPLLQVLPGWHIGLGDERLWLVYPVQRFMPPKVRAFLDLIESKFSFRATAEGGSLTP